jgi:hypothetical protein
VGKRKKPDGADNLDKRDKKRRKVHKLSANPSDATEQDDKVESSYPKILELTKEKNFKLFFGKEVVEWDSVKAVWIELRKKHEDKIYWIKAAQWTLAKKSRRERSRKTIYSRICCDIDRRGISSFAIEANKLLKHYNSCESDYRLMLEDPPENTPEEDKVYLRELAKPFFRMLKEEQVKKHSVTVNGIEYHCEYECQGSTLLMNAEIKGLAVSLPIANLWKINRGSAFQQNVPEVVFTCGYIGCVEQDKVFYDSQKMHDHNLTYHPEHQGTLEQNKIKKEDDVRRDIFRYFKLPGSGGDEKIQCAMCDKQFLQVRRNNLRRHYIQSHYNKAHRLKEESLLLVASDTAGDDKLPVTPSRASASFFGASTANLYGSFFPTNVHSGSNIQPTPFTVKIKTPKIAGPIFTLVYDSQQLILTEKSVTSAGRSDGLTRKSTLNLTLFSVLLHMPLEEQSAPAAVFAPVLSFALPETLNGQYISLLFPKSDLTTEPSSLTNMPVMISDKSIWPELPDECREKAEIKATGVSILLRIPSPPNTPDAQFIFKLVPVYTYKTPELLARDYTSLLIQNPFLSNTLNLIGVLPNYSQSFSRRVEAVNELISVSVPVGTSPFSTIFHISEAPNTSPELVFESNPFSSASAPAVSGNNLQEPPVSGQPLSRGFG